MTKKMSGRYLLFATVLIAFPAAIAALCWYVSQADKTTLDGQLPLEALQQPVTVYRDTQGIPYIYAGSLDDALTAQGFVTAQDRLFQMELFKYLAHGRLAELIGEKGLKNDRLVRLLDLTSLAARQAERLTEPELNFIARYVNGINAYIETRQAQHPLVFSMMDVAAKPWQVTDVLAIQFFQIWSSSANWRQELFTQELIDHLGFELAQQIFPISINPDVLQVDVDKDIPRLDASARNLPSGLDLSFASGLLDNPYRLRHAMGSNGWVSGKNKSVNGAPILVNDPHIDVRRLPGFWYPIGLITPHWRAVGAAAPGVPGLGVARSNFIAWGATNGYSDMVDLYIEEIDPLDDRRYLEGQKSFSFSERKEIIKIKDEQVPGNVRTETMLVRSTHRGPIISDLGMYTTTGKVLSLRWSVPEFIGSATGNRELLLAKNLDEARLAIAKTATPLNYLLADYAGNIARIASGFVPKRRAGKGLIPQKVRAQDNWNGRISAADMPAQINPLRDWVGSANHNVIPENYPYAYSTYFSPSWRYRRLVELFAQPKVSSDDHWRFLLDNKNMMAQRLIPIIVTVLRTDSQFHSFANILAQWNFMDDGDQAAPLIFQTLYNEFASKVFADELGKGLATKLLNDSYYWQERLAKMFIDNNSVWFDNKNTPVKETRDSLLRDAAAITQKKLQERFGSKPSPWRWADANKLTFSHPVFPGEEAAKWLGGGVVGIDGSTETLNRAVSFFDEPGVVKIIPSMRIVMDLSDPDKLQAHIPGGSSERLFSTYGKNQLAAWLKGEPTNWWFSDDAIKQHVKHTLILGLP